MKRYEMIGVRNEEQANRILGRLVAALNGEIKLELDLEHSIINSSAEINPYILSIISSFEQVSIMKKDEAEATHHDHDEHEHNHEHGHHHTHDFGTGNQARRNMMIVFLMNLIFSLGEFVFGALFNSQAILTDAVHDLGDALSIGLAYFFEKTSSRKATTEFTYGYRRFSLLGAFVTSVILIVGASVMIVSTIPELANPTPINYRGVFWVAIGAIFINGVSVWLMSSGKSANERLLNIHLFEDLFGWILVLIMSIVLNYTNWYILDSILSLFLASWILYVTLPEFFRISKIFLQAVPAEIDLEDLHHQIEKVDGVIMISHFHIWSTDGEQHMMSLTVTTPLHSNEQQEKMKQAIRKAVLKYNISHITIEILYDPDRLINESASCEN